MTFWKTSDFKALQQEWYERLKSDGFRDAESVIDEELCLKTTADAPYRKKSKLEREMKEAYFRIIASHAHAQPFRNETHRLILMRYAEGAMIKVIVAELQEIGQYRCRNSVTFIIRRYEMEWGLKEYTPRQLNRKQT